MGPAELGDECRGARRIERLKGDGSEGSQPAAPVRAPLDQLRPRQCDDHQRDVPRPAGDGLQQVEEGIVGPVHVLDHEAQWLVAGQRLEEAASRRVQRSLVDQAAGPVPVVVEAGQQGHVAGHVGPVRPGRGDGRHQLAELAAGRGRWVLGGGAGRLAHRLGQGGVGERLAVGQAAPAHHPSLACDPTLELGQLAGLAHARLAEDRHQLGSAPGDAAAPDAHQQVELRVAPDERRRPEGAGLAHRAGAHCGIRAGAEVRVLDHRAGGRVRGPTDDDGADLGLGLQPAGLVHHLAHDGEPALGGWAGGGEEHLAGRHPRPHLDTAELVGVVAHGALEAEGGAHGALGVVLVGDGRAEHGEEVATDDAVHRAAVAGDHRRQPGHAAVEQRAQVLGIQGVGHAVEAGQAGGHDRRRPA